MKDIAIEAALEAGNILSTSFGKIKNIQKKDKAGLVTEVDKNAEGMVLKIISKAYPKHSFLCEESGKTDIADSNFRWIIDPLDGTTNYVHGLQFFCVSIALEERGKVVLAVIYAPALGEFYVAEPGLGAYLYDLPPFLKNPHHEYLKNPRKLHVTKTNSLDDALMATGFSYRRTENITTELESFKRFLAKTRAIRRLGSAALDLCYLARGIYDGYWERGLCPWDTAAAQLIVTEAGGKVTNFSGAAYDYYKSDIVASNSALHKVILENF